jgi:Protein of unknown function (DUF2865).
MPSSDELSGRGDQSLSLHRVFRRVLATSGHFVSRHKRVGLVALCGPVLAGAAGLALAQPMSDQQIRCMQLQQELAGAQGGGGRDALPGIEKQIQDANRVFQGTQAAMEDASCFESFFIFGRALVRSPKCLKMNDRMEDARHQLSQLQDQRDAIMGGGGNRRRQSDLQDALARNGCGGQAPQQARREGGGPFNWFGGQQQEEEQPRSDLNISRSINPNAPYRTVCVRLCDGFYYPISYSTYPGRFSQDVTQCQSNCAAPAELYVYRNPGEEIEQAISLNGAPYNDLPVAFKFRKSYTTGCSCKEAEYNPTEIEQANKKAEATPPAKPGSKQAAKKAPVPAPDAAASAPQAAAPAKGAQPPPQLNLDITGSNTGPADGTTAAATPPAPAPAATPPAAAAPQPVPPAQQSSIAKSKTPPAPH